MEQHVIRSIKYQDDVLILLKILKPTFFPLKLSKQLISVTVYNILSFVFRVHFFSLHLSLSFLLLDEQQKIHCTFKESG